MTLTQPHEARRDDIGQNMCQWLTDTCPKKTSPLSSVNLQYRSVLFSLRYVLGSTEEAQ